MVRFLVVVLVTLLLVGCGESNEPTSTTTTTTGAAGQPGARGTTGEQGPPGPSGPMGPAGSQGPRGEQGAQGPSGPAGPAGAKGDPGAQGPQGAQGAVGPAGAQGPQGSAGAQGAQGPAGAGMALNKVYTVQGNPVGPDGVGTGYAEVFCQAGDMAIGGGCRFTGNAAGSTTTVKVYDFGMLQKNGLWGYSCTGTNVTSNQVVADVVCVDL